MDECEDSNVILACLHELTRPARRSHHHSFLTLLAHAPMLKHTNARSSCMVDNKPGVARRTLGSAVHETICISCWPPVFACTSIYCNGTSASVREFARACACQNKHKYIRVQPVLARLIVYPGLHEAHRAAPFA